MLTKMSPYKIVTSLLKWTVVLFLINLFVIDPGIRGISKAINNAADKRIFKIVSLDFITNPMTFCRLAEFAIDNKNYKNAELYLQYAEIIEVRYSYPPIIKSEIKRLRLQLKSLKLN